MSLEEDLKRCTEDLALDKPPKPIALALSSFPSLTGYLATLKTPEDVALVLGWELKRLRRVSYINRIYGRYHRLLPKRDYAFLHSIDPELQRDGES